MNVMKKRGIIAFGMAALLLMGSCGSGNPGESSSAEGNDPAGQIGYDGYGIAELETYIDIGPYKGLEPISYDVTVTEEDRQAMREEYLKAAEYRDFADHDTVAEGDIANLDCRAEVNGEKYDEGSVESQDVEIGAGLLLQDVEEAVIGKKAGDTFQGKTSFPEDYAVERLRGKTVIFRGRINSARKRILPEYNDDFVRKNTEYENKEAFEAAMEEFLKKQKKTEGLKAQKTDLLQQVMAATTMKKYPKDELRYFMELHDAQLDAAAKSRGLSREAMLKNSGYDGEADFAETNEESCKELIKQELVILYIARKEDITYTEEEKVAYRKELGENNSSSDYIQATTGRNLDAFLNLYILMQKVQDDLLEHAAPGKSGKAF